MRGNSTISNRCRCHRTAAVDHRTSCRWRPPYADLCYIEGNDAAKKLYESFGFVEIDRDEDEIIMEMNL